MNSHKTFRTFIAAFTVFTFFITSLGISPNAFAAASVPPQGLGGQAEVSLPYQLKLDENLRVAIPQELGKLEHFNAGQGPAIFHIQTAHGHYQSQKQIQSLLHYLDKNYGVKTVLVEGSAFKLEPGILNFFPKDQKLTLAIADELTRQALVKGPELYLLDKQFEKSQTIKQKSPISILRSSEDASAYGIENAGAYNANRASFVDVLNEKKKTEQFLSDMDLQIERLASQLLNQDLRNFLRRVEAFEKNQIPLDTWLANLKEEAAKRLEIDLASPAYQLDWPMMVRFFKIQELSSKWDRQKFPKEREEFLKAIRRFLPSKKATDQSQSKVSSLQSPVFSQIESLLRNDSMSQQLPDPETSLLFEDMVRRLPENFNYEAFPNVRCVIGTLLLQSELKADRLMREVQKLSDTLAEKLTRTKEEKKLIALLIDHRLLQKLFALELTPEDYEVILGARGSHLGTRLKPSSISARFIEIGGRGSGPAKTRNQNESRVPRNESRVRNVQFTHVADLDMLFDKAMKFYEGVKERDGVMEKMVERRIQETGATKVAVITGGFHAEPFYQYFSSKDYSYALISPKLTGADDQGHEAYIQNMLHIDGALSLGTRTSKKQRIQASPESRVPSPELQGSATIESSFATARETLSGYVLPITNVVRAKFGRDADAIKQHLDEVAAGIAVTRGELVPAPSAAFGHSVFGTTALAHSEARSQASESARPAGNIQDHRWEIAKNPAEGFQILHHDGNIVSTLIHAKYSDKAIVSTNPVSISFALREGDPAEGGYSNTDWVLRLDESEAVSMSYTFQTGGGAFFSHRSWRVTFLKDRIQITANGEKFDSQKDGKKFDEARPISIRFVKSEPVLEFRPEVYAWLNGKTGPIQTTNAVRSEVRENNSLQQVGEVLRGDASAAKDGAKSAGLDGLRTMNRDNGAAAEIGVVAQNGVTAGLTQKNEPGFLKGADHAVAVDLRNEGHESGFKGDRNIADHHVGFLQRLAVLLHGPAVKMNGFLNVLDRFLAGFSLRGASGEFGNVNGITAFLLLLQNYLVFHDRVSFADFLTSAASFGIIAQPALFVQPARSEVRNEAVERALIDAASGAIEMALEKAELYLDTQPGSVYRLIETSLNEFFMGDLRNGNIAHALIELVFAMNKLQWHVEHRHQSFAELQSAAWGRLSDIKNQLIELLKKDPKQLAVLQQDLKDWKRSEKFHRLSDERVREELQKIHLAILAEQWDERATTNPDSPNGWAMPKEKFGTGKKVCVVGGLGFIGSNTAWMLKRLGYEVVIYDNRTTGHLKALPTGVKLEEGDIADSEHLVRVLRDQKIDTIVHFAADIQVTESVANPSKYYEDNVRNTGILLEAMRIAGVKNIIFSSSAAVYGDPETTPINEDARKLQTSPYGHTKWLMEKMIQEYVKKHGFHAVALRYFNAAGAFVSLNASRQANFIEKFGEERGYDRLNPSHIIPIFVNLILQGKNITIFGRDYPTSDGTNDRDYVATADLAVVHALAVKKVGEMGTEHYLAANVGTGVRVSNLEIARMIIREIARQKPGWTYKGQILFDDRRSGDPTVLEASTDLAKKELGFETKIGIEEIIAADVRWRIDYPEGYEDELMPAKLEPGALSRLETVVAWAKGSELSQAYQLELLQAMLSDEINKYREAPHVVLPGEYGYLSQRGNESQLNEFKKVRRMLSDATMRERIQKEDPAQIAALDYLDEQIASYQSPLTSTNSRSEVRTKQRGNVTEVLQRQLARAQGGLKRLHAEEDGLDEVSQRIDRKERQVNDLEQAVKSSRARVVSSRSEARNHQPSFSLSDAVATLRWVSGKVPAARGSLEEAIREIEGRNFEQALNEMVPVAESLKGFGENDPVMEGFGRAWMAVSEALRVAPAEKFVGFSPNDGSEVAMPVTGEMVDQILKLGGTKPVIAAAALPTTRSEVRATGIREVAPALLPLAEELFENGVSIDQVIQFAAFPDHVVPKSKQSIIRGILDREHFDLSNRVSLQALMRAFKEIEVAIPLSVSVGQSSSKGTYLGSPQFENNRLYVLDHQGKVRIPTAELAQDINQASWMPQDVRVQWPGNGAMVVSNRRSGFRMNVLYHDDEDSLASLKNAINIAAASAAPAIRSEARSSFGAESTQAELSYTAKARLLTLLLNLPVVAFSAWLFYRVFEHSEEPISLKDVGPLAFSLFVLAGGLVLVRKIVSSVYGWGVYLEKAVQMARRGMLSVNDLVEMIEKIKHLDNEIDRSYQGGESSLNSLSVQRSVRVRLFKRVVQAIRHPEALKAVQERVNEMIQNLGDPDNWGSSQKVAYTTLNEISEQILQPRIKALQAKDANKTPAFESQASARSEVRGGAPSEFPQVNAAKFVKRLLEKGDFVGILRPPSALGLGAFVAAQRIGESFLMLGATGPIDRLIALNENRYPKFVVLSHFRGTPFDGSPMFTTAEFDPKMFGGFYGVIMLAVGPVFVSEVARALLKGQSFQEAVKSEPLFAEHLRVVSKVSFAGQPSAAFMPRSEVRGLTTGERETGNDERINPSEMWTSVDARMNREVPLFEDVTAKVVRMNPDNAPEENPQYVIQVKPTKVRWTESGSADESFSFEMGPGADVPGVEVSLRDGQTFTLIKNGDPVENKLVVTFTVLEPSKSFRFSVSHFEVRSSLTDEVSADEITVQSEIPLADFIKGHVSKTVDLRDAFHIYVTGPVSVRRQVTEWKNQRYGFGEGFFYDLVAEELQDLLLLPGAKVKVSRSEVRNVKTGFRGWLDRIWPGGHTPQALQNSSLWLEMESVKEFLRPLGFTPDAAAKRLSVILNTDFYTLDLGGANLTDVQLLNFCEQAARVNGLPHLTKLVLSNNEGLTNLGPLQSLKGLRSLHIAGTQVKKLEPLEHLPILRLVDASNTPVSPMEIQRFQKKMPGVMVPFSKGRPATRSEVRRSLVWVLSVVAVLAALGVAAFSNYQSLRAIGEYDRIWRPGGEIALFQEALSNTRRNPTPENHKKAMEALVLGLQYPEPKLRDLMNGILRGYKDEGVRALAQGYGLTVGGFSVENTKKREQFHAAITEALKRFGKPAYPVLLTALKDDPDPAVREGVATALGAMGNGDPALDVLSALGKAYQKDPSKDVQEKAGAALRERIKRQIDKENAERQQASSSSHLRLPLFPDFEVAGVVMIGWGIVLFMLHQDEKQDQALDKEFLDALRKLSPDQPTDRVIVSVLQSAMEKMPSGKNLNLILPILDPFLGHSTEPVWPSPAALRDLRYAVTIEEDEEGSPAPLILENATLTLNSVRSELREGAISGLKAPELIAALEKIAMSEVLQERATALIRELQKTPKRADPLARANLFVREHTPLEITKSRKPPAFLNPGQRSEMRMQKLSEDAEDLLKVIALSKFWFFEEGYVTLGNVATAYMQVRKEYPWLGLKPDITNAAIGRALYGRKDSLGPQFFLKDGKKFYRNGAGESDIIETGIKILAEALSRRIGKSTQVKDSIVTDTNSIRTTAKTQHMIQGIQLTQDGISKFDFRTQQSFAADGSSFFQTYGVKRHVLANLISEVNAAAARSEVRGGFSVIDESVLKALHSGDATKVAGATDYLDAKVEGVLARGKNLWEHSDFQNLAQIRSMEEFYQLATDLTRILTVLAELLKDTPQNVVKAPAGVTTATAPVTTTAPESVWPAFQKTEAALGTLLGHFLQMTDNATNGLKKDPLWLSQTATKTASSLAAGLYPALSALLLMEKAPETHALAGEIKKVFGRIKVAFMAIDQRFQQAKVVFGSHQEFFGDFLSQEEFFGDIDAARQAIQTEILEPLKEVAVKMQGEQCVYAKMSKTWDHKPYFAIYAFNFRNLVALSSEAKAMPVKNIKRELDEWTAHGILSRVEFQVEGDKLIIKDLTDENAVPAMIDFPGTGQSFDLEAIKKIGEKLAAALEPFSQPRSQVLAYSPVDAGAWVIRKADSRFFDTPPATETELNQDSVVLKHTNGAEFRLGPELTEIIPSPTALGAKRFSGKAIPVLALAVPKADGEKPLVVVFEDEHKLSLEFEKQTGNSVKFIPFSVYAREKDKYTEISSVIVPTPTAKPQTVSQMSVAGEPILSSVTLEVNADFLPVNDFLAQRLKTEGVLRDAKIMKIVLKGPLLTQDGREIEAKDRTINFGPEGFQHKDSFAFSGHQLRKGVNTVEIFHARSEVRAEADPSNFVDQLARPKLEEAGYVLVKNQIDDLGLHLEIRRDPTRPEDKLSIASLMLKFQFKQRFSGKNLDIAVQKAEDAQKSVVAAPARAEVRNVTAEEMRKLFDELAENAILKFDGAKKLEPAAGDKWLSAVSLDGLSSPNDPKFWGFVLTDEAIELRNTSPRGSIIFRAGLSKTELITIDPYGNSQSAKTYEDPFPVAAFLVKREDGSIRIAESSGIFTVGEYVDIDGFAKFITPEKFQSVQQEIAPGEKPPYFVLAQVAFTQPPFRIPSPVAAQPSVAASTPAPGLLSPSFHQPARGTRFGGAPALNETPAPQTKKSWWKRALGRSEVRNLAPQLKIRSIKTFGPKTKVEGLVYKVNFGSVILEMSPASRDSLNLGASLDTEGVKRISLNLKTNRGEVLGEITLQLGPNLRLNFWWPNQEKPVPQDLQNFLDWFVDSKRAWTKNGFASLIVSQTTAAAPVKKRSEVRETPVDYSLKFLPPGKNAILSSEYNGEQHQWESLPLDIRDAGVQKTLRDLTKDLSNWTQVSIVAPEVIRRPSAGTQKDPLEFSLATGFDRRSETRSGLRTAPNGTANGAEILQQFRELAEMLKQSAKPLPEFVNLNNLWGTPRDRIIAINHALLQTPFQRRYLPASNGSTAVKTANYFYQLRVHPGPEWISLDENSKVVGQDSIRYARIVSIPQQWLAEKKSFQLIESITRYFEQRSKEQTARREFGTNLPKVRQILLEAVSRAEVRIGQAQQALNREITRLDFDKAKVVFEIPEAEVVRRIASILDQGNAFDLMITGLRENQKPEDAAPHITGVYEVSWTAERQVTLRSEVRKEDPVLAEAEKLFRNGSGQTITVLVDRIAKVGNRARLDVIEAGVKAFKLAEPYRTNILKAIDAARAALARSEVREIQATGNRLQSPVSSLQVVYSAAPRNVAAIRGMYRDPWVVESVTQNFRFGVIALRIMDALRQAGALGLRVIERVSGISLANAAETALAKQNAVTLASKPETLNPSKVKAARGVFGETKNKTSDAFIIGATFAFDRFAVAALRAIFGDAPMMVLVRNDEDRAKLAKVNFELVKAGRTEILKADDTSGVRTFMAEEKVRQRGAGRELRFKAIVDANDSMAIALKEMIPDFVWVNDANFGSFMFQAGEAIQTLVANFQRNYVLGKSA